jgi:hypothetical protein
MVGDNKKGKDNDSLQIKAEPKAEILYEIVNS